MDRYHILWDIMGIMVSSNIFVIVQWRLGHVAFSFQPVLLPMPSPSSPFSFQCVLLPMRSPCNAFSFQCVPLASSAFSFQCVLLEVRSPSPSSPVSFQRVLLPKHSPSNARRATKSDAPTSPNAAPATESHTIRSVRQIA